MDAVGLTGDGGQLTGDRGQETGPDPLVVRLSNHERGTNAGAPLILREPQDEREGTLVLCSSFENLTG